MPVAAMAFAVLPASASTAKKATPKVAEQTITWINCGPTFSVVSGAAILSQYLGYLPHVTINAETSSGTGACVQALTSGTADLSAPALESIDGPVSQGQTLNVRYVDEWIRHDAFQIAVAPGSPIKSVGELAHHIIGVTTIGGAQEAFAQAALTAAGVPLSTVSFEAVGDGAAAAEDVLNGTVAAECQVDVIWGTFTGLGYDTRILPDPNEGGIRNVPGPSILANASWASANPKLVIEFIRALAEATIFQRTNPAAMAYIFFQHYPAYLVPGESLAQNIAAVVPQFKARSEYGYPIVPSSPTDGEFTKSQWTALLAFDGLTASVTPAEIDQYWTNAYSSRIGYINAAAIVKRAKAFKIPSSL
jgi:ABC-type nitrate/sulfonate/bicarbonate transport system substrate-binding protein